MNINDIFIHDSRIQKVLEYSDSNTFEFFISWPKDWENDIFVNAKLTFYDVLEYEVHEGPFSGSPDILSMKESGTRIDYGCTRTRIVINTSAGFRALYCTDVMLTNTTIT